MDSHIVVLVRHPRAPPGHSPPPSLVRTRLWIRVRHQLRTEIKLCKEVDHELVMEGNGWWSHEGVVMPVWLLLDELEICVGCLKNLHPNTTVECDRIWCPPPLNVEIVTYLCRQLRWAERHIKCPELLEALRSRERRGRKKREDARQERKEREIQHSHRYLVRLLTGLKGLIQSYFLYRLRSGSDYDLGLCADSLAWERGREA